MRTLMILIALVCCSPLVGSAQESDFLAEINGGGDGSSSAQAITLPNKCDFSPCAGDQACMLKVLRETISQQQLTYLTNKYGQKGKDWDILRVNDVVNVESGHNIFFDDVVIRVVGSADRTPVFFNVTSSVLAMRELVKQPE